MHNPSLRISQRGEEMQFLATATHGTDVTVSTEGYEHVRDVECPTCGKVFRLWAPFLETEASEVQAQTDWLSKRLLRDCPEHVVDVIRTPDRPR